MELLQQWLPPGRFLYEDLLAICSKLYFYEPTNCWVYVGPRRPDSYADHVLRSGKWIRVHVWLYELLHGPLPDGYVVDHLCEVKLCINPDHHQAVTQGDNVRISISRKSANSQTARKKSEEIELGRFG